MPKSRSTSKPRKEGQKHPWIQLLDLERSSPIPEPPKQEVGRPKRRFPRDKRTLLMFTQEELASIDMITNMLKERIGKKVSRTDVIAFMTFRLIDDIKQFSNDGTPTIPDNIASFTELATYLDENAINRKGG